MVVMIERRKERHSSPPGPPQPATVSQSHSCVGAAPLVNQSEPSLDLPASVWERIHSIHCDLHRYNISEQPPNNSIISSSISAQLSPVSFSPLLPIQLWKFAGLNFADTIQSPLPLVVIIVVIVSLVYKYWPKFYLPCPCLCRCVCLLHNSDTDRFDPTGEQR